MKITTNLKIENSDTYSFVNVLIFLDGITLGDDENFDLKGTVILDFLNLIENINLLIQDDNCLNLEKIIEWTDFDLDKYSCSINDLLPRGSSLFDGDKLLAFKVKNNEFTAICKPYNQEIIIFKKFPLISYLIEMNELKNKLL